MRIEKETEVTIKVKIGYVWPDDFEDDFGKPTLTEEEFRTHTLVEDGIVAQEIILDLWEKVYDLLQASEVTVRDLGIVQE